MKQVRYKFYPNKAASNVLRNVKTVEISKSNNSSKNIVGLIKTSETDRLDIKLYERSDKSRKETGFNNTRLNGVNLRPQTRYLMKRVNKNTWQLITHSKTATRKRFSEPMASVFIR